MTAAAREPIPAQLARQHQALYDEFVRITGLTGRQEFSEWIQLVENQLLLERLQAMAPVQFPSLDLTK